MQIAIADDVDDVSLGSLLHTVYVDGGYTTAALAASLFAPQAVRERGTLFAARAPGCADLLGMVIVVPPGSPCRQIAADHEAEMQLLAVHPSARGRGTASALVRAGVRWAGAQGYRRLVLSTQSSMASAQRIYASLGFARVPARDWTRSERVFLAYELPLEAV